MLVHRQASALRLSPESPEDTDLLNSLADFFAKSSAYAAATREGESSRAESTHQLYVWLGSSAGFAATKPLPLSGS